MKKTTGCEYANKIKSSKRDKNLELHIAGCAECQQSQKVFDFMQKFAAQSEPPQNLPAPGFLMFKARILQKQAALKRAVQPIFWMQIAASVLFVTTIGWFLGRSQTPIISILKGTLLSLLSVAPLFVIGAVSAVVICFAFNYFLHKANK